MLTLLLLLAGGRSYTIPEVCEKFGTSVRTFHRYISTFKDAGIIVEQESGRYRIRKLDTCLRKLSDLLHFSEEEALILNKAILSIHDENLLKQNLIKKLFSIYDFDRVADTIVKPEYSENIHKLITAIHGKKQVVIHNYRSAHGHGISDRRVEPFDFTSNYQTVWAFDLRTGECRQFKIARMREVEVCDEAWENELLHKTMLTDPFRMSSAVKTNVKIKLSLRAYDLLIEEYPLAESFIGKLSDNEYFYEGFVCGFEGIGRFCLGLIDEVEIISPRSFVQFLKKKIKNSVLS